MIYIECKPDLALLKSIADIPKRERVHSFQGKYEICKILERQRNCIGLLDEDPLSIQPPYLKRLQPDMALAQHDFRVLRDGSSGNCLILLCPKLEDWILRAAKEADIGVGRYGLPDDADKLHREINVRLDNFEKLLEALREKNPDRLKALKGVLEREK